MKTFKRILSVILLIITIETLSYITGLPFTVIDVLLLPLSIILIAMGVKSLLVPDRTNKANITTRLSLMQFCASLLFTLIFFLPLGLWSLQEGWHHPFALYSGVKGAGHGYTLVTIGLLISIYSV